MPGNLPIDKQCWMKKCYKVATHSITYDRRKVKVCKDHSHWDGTHWHWTAEHGSQACRRKNCKLK